MEVQEAVKTLPPCHVSFRARHDSRILMEPMQSKFEKVTRTEEREALSLNCTCKFKMAARDSLSFPWSYF